MLRTDICSTSVESMALGRQEHGRNTPASLAQLAAAVHRPASLSHLCGRGVETPQSCESELTMVDYNMKSKPPAYIPHTPPKSSGTEIGRNLPEPDFCICMTMNPISLDVLV